MAIMSEVQQQDVSPETRSVDAHSTEGNAEEGDFKPFSGHTNSIQAMTYSPNDKFIVTGSRDHTIRIWDVKSGRQVGGAMHGHTNVVRDVSYSPDENSFVSCSNDGTVRIWDTADARNAPVQTIEHAGCQIGAVQVSPDGRFIASGGSDRKLKIWDAREKAFKSGYGEHPERILSIAWEPSGKRLATGGGTDGKIRVFELAKPDVVALLVEGHQDRVNSLMYSPDGKLLASGASDDSVRLWDAQTGKAVKSPFRGHTYGVTSVAWSPDGTRIISGSWDMAVRVWDVISGQSLFNGPLYAHEDSIYIVSYSPDGKSFASAGGGDVPRVQIWDAQTGKPSLPLLSNEEQSNFKKLAEERFADTRRSEPGEMKAGAAVSAIVWFPDGQRFATVGEESLLRIWSARTGKQTRDMATRYKTVNALSISADGTKLATASTDCTLILFDTTSMQPLTEPLTGHDGTVYAVKLTDDGSRVISGSKDKTVRFWDALTGKVHHVVEAHTDGVRALALTKDGIKLASGGDDGCIYIWDMQTYGRLAGPFKHEGSVRALSFSPDGSRLISGSDDFIVRVWNAVTGKLALDPIRVHTGPVGAVDWSPDGTKLLTSGAHDWTIWVWDASTGGCKHGPLQPYLDLRADGVCSVNGIRAAAFSPDGKRFVGGFMDHRLRMWDTDSGRVVLMPEDDKGAETESSSDESESTSDEPQRKAETSKREGVRRRNTDDSIDNMPATIRKEAASRAKGFWYDANFNDPPRRQEKSNVNKESKDVDESQNKGNRLKQLWQRGGVRHVLRSKGQNKAPNPESPGPEQHTMTRVPRPPPKEISAAHDKLRVVAAGHDPRQRFRGDQMEPESDVEEESPTGSADPNQPGAGTSSDDESEHGLAETICFCLCIPCCK